MTHEDVRVPDSPEGVKLIRDFIDRACDQGFCRDTAIAPGQRLLQDRLCLRRRLADIDVTPQDDGSGIFSVSSAALAIEVGLRACLFAGEAGACDPTLRQSCRAVDSRRCAGADPDLDGL